MKSCKPILARCKGGILAALALCFIAVVYGPLELYFTNREDFWFAPDVILPETLTLFVIGGGTLVVLLLLIDHFLPKLHMLYTACCLWGIVVCYIQSNFLSGWLPKMDGAEVDWSAYPGERLASIILCVAAAALVALLAYKKWLEKAAFFGSGALSLMLLITLITLGIGSTASDGSYYYSNVEGLQEYSTDKNFVIFVVDSVDGDTFEEVVNETPEYQQVLQDFTYYNNAVCAYPYTYYAVPNMLTGEWYEGETSFEKYRSQALKNSPLFENLQNQGYKMGLYYDDKLFDKTSEPERFFNLRWQSSEIVSHPAFWRVILRMSCVKNAPFDLKYLGYSLPEKLNALKHGNLYDADTWYDGDNVRFVNYCETHKIEHCSNKMFKYIHVDGAHIPYRYGPHLEDVQGTKEATYKNNVAATLYVIEQYLTMLRENDAYDDSAIIIMSDHGYAQDENGNEVNLGRQHSIFLAKGFGESHVYTVNKAPFSYADLQSAYQRLLSGIDSSALIDYKEGDTRERRFLNYLHEKGVSEINRKAGFIEMIQTGEAGNLNTLKETGNVYIPPVSIGGD